MVEIMSRLLEQANTVQVFCVLLFSCRIQNKKETQTYKTTVLHTEELRRMFFKMILSKCLKCVAADAG